MFCNAHVVPPLVSSEMILHFTCFQKEFPFSKRMTRTWDHCASGIEHGMGLLCIRNRLCCLGPGQRRVEMFFPYCSPKAFHLHGPWTKQILLFHMHHIVWVNTIRGHMIYRNTPPSSLHPVFPHKCPFLHLFLQYCFVCFFIK